MSDETQPLLDLATRAVKTNQSLLCAIDEIKQLQDDYAAITAVTPYTDALFTGTSLAYLSAYNIATLIGTVLPVFQQVYQDSANYTAQAGLNKNIMDLCHP